MRNGHDTSYISIYSSGFSIKYVSVYTYVCNLFWQTIVISVTLSLSLSFIRPTSIVCAVQSVHTLRSTYFNVFSVKAVANPISLCGYLALVHYSDASIHSKEHTAAANTQFPFICCCCCFFINI